MYFQSQWAKNASNKRILYCEKCLPQKPELEQAISNIVNKLSFIYPIYSLKPTIDYCIQKFDNFYYQEIMKQTYQRRREKENNYTASPVARSKTPTLSQTSNLNNALRLKLEENIAKYEGSVGHERSIQNSQKRNITDRQSRNSSALKGKRQTAKNRGFDLMVSNISNINQKINSLLNMVKKDKNVEKIQKQKIIIKKQAQSPKTDLIQNYRKDYPTITPFARDSSPFSRERYQIREQVQNYKADKRPRFGLLESMKQQSLVQEEDSRREDESFYNRQFQRLKTTGNTKEDPKNLKQIRRKYLPDSPPKKNPQKQVGDWWQSVIQQSQYAPKEMHKYQKSKIDNGQKSKDIDKMLQQRRKKREQEREEDRVKLEKTFIMESKVSLSDPEQKYAPKRGQKSANYLPATAINQTERTEKINTTTRLIDEQIKRIKSKIQQSQTTNQRNQNKLNIKPQVNDSIYSNHEKSSSHFAQDKQQTLLIAELFSNQVQLDNHLRDVRVAFYNTQGEEKWLELKEKLEQNGMKLSIAYLQQLIKVTSDEHNPFGKIKQTELGQSIVQSLFQAQSHWQDKISGCTTSKILRSEGFNIQQMDLNKKGCLAIEDLVCFVNLYTGNFYRNRDLTLIFRRLQLQAGEQGQSLSFRAFEKAITS